MTKDGFEFSESGQDARPRREDEHAPHEADACGRGGELVAYLYEEAGADERRSFELHMNDCAACREELTAFRVVRRSVGEWRDEALSIAPAFAFSAQAASAPEGGDAAGRKASARAALRAFFTLSPAWLRVSFAAAVLLVCALAALTLARAEVSWGEGGLAFRTGVGERVVERRVEVPVAQGFTREQVDAIAAERVERALAEYRDGAGPAREGQLVNASESKSASAQSDNTAGGPVSRAKRRGRAAPTTRGNRPMLVELDDDLPRLSDLLSVAN